MFVQITWSQYFEYIILGLTVYYIACFVFFGKNLIIGYLNKSKEANASRIWGVTQQSQELLDPEAATHLDGFDQTNSSVLSGKLPAPFGETTAQNTLYPLVHDLVNEIESLLKSKGELTIKNEILQDLSAVVQKYPPLRITEFQNSINYLIAVTCQNYCAITLNEAEIKDLWG